MMIFFFFFFSSIRWNICVSLWVCVCRWIPVYFAIAWKSIGFISVFSLIAALLLFFYRFFLLISWVLYVFVLFFDRKCFFLYTLSECIHSFMLLFFELNAIYLQLFMLAFATRCAQMSTNAHFNVPVCVCVCFLYSFIPNMAIANQIYKIYTHRNIDAEKPYQ